MKRLFCLIIIISGFLTQSFSIKESENLIDKNEAIKLAEQFIIDNGYTSKDVDKSKIKFELLDEEIDEALKFRYNSLHEKAYCFFKDDKEWNIGFLSTKINIDKLTAKQKNSDLEGRAVKVSVDGKNVHIAHKDPRFSTFTKL